MLRTDERGDKNSKNVDILLSYQYHERERKREGRDPWHPQRQLFYCRVG